MKITKFIIIISLLLLSIFLLFQNCSKKKPKVCSKECSKNQICYEQTKTCVDRDKICGGHICKENEVCKQSTVTCTSTIVSKCTNIVCGLNETCDEITGNCIQIPTDMYEACNNENGNCSFDPLKKLHGESCSQHDECTGNICLSYDNNEKAEYVFTNGYCTSFCHLGCPLQTACVENIFSDNYCLKKCNNTKDCRNDYQCQKISDLVSVCMPIIQNYHDSNQTQKGNIGSNCKSNEDCLDNLECMKTSLSLENGFCTLLQCDILSCPDKAKCITLPGNIHACVSSCKENENCDTLSVCSNTESFFPVSRSKPCSEKANCNADEICFNEQCYTACNSANDCHENEQCLGYSDNTGKQIRLCAESEKVCKPKDYSQSCQSHAECGNCENGGDSLCEYLFGAEYTCDTSNFTCQKTCNSHEIDCKKEKRYCDMNSQTCIPLCQKDQDCAYSEKCNLKSGQCEKSCNSNDQCREKEFCNEAKICEYGSCKTIGCSSVLYSCNQGNNALTQEQCLPHCGNIFSQTSTISTKGKCPAGFVCSNFGICIHEN